MLEGRGWVARSRSPHDGRAMEVRFTEAGRGIALRLAEARRVKFTRVLAAVPDEERVSVVQALRVLEEAMSKDG